MTTKNDEWINIYSEGNLGVEVSMEINKTSRSYVLRMRHYPNNTDMDLDYNQVGFNNPYLAFYSIAKAIDKITKERNIDKFYYETSNSKYDKRNEYFLNKFGWTSKVIISFSSCDNIYLAIKRIP